jgi:hypothetical protein
MKTKNLRTAIAAVFTLAVFLGARQGALAQFPPRGDDLTQSLGQFNIVINPTFQPLMAGYPGYSASTHILTSPVLYDGATIIGRSDPLHRGSAVDTGGVLVGSAGTSVSDSLLVVEPGGLEPAGTREVHTMVYSLNMVPFGPAGTAVRAGTNATTRPISPGEVESYSGPSGLPANDFPAQSFFDVFVEVDIAGGGGFPGATNLFNTLPLMVQNTNLTSFPPTVVYIHGMSTAVPIKFSTSHPPLWNAGDTFGLLTLAGHGVFQTNSSTGQNTTEAQAQTQLQNTLASTPPAPVEPQYSTWSSATTTANSNTMIFPAKGDDNTTSLGTFVLAVNPAYQPFMSGYPGWNPATKRLTSPLLFDQATLIGRSSPLTVGSSNDMVGVPVGSANTVVSNGMFALIPPLFPSPSNTFEVKTEVRSLNLAGGGGAVRAGTAAPGVRKSVGEVDSLSGPSGDPYWDFPAKSFFDIFVDVDLPAGGGFTSGFTLSNAVPLIVQQNTLMAFPPKVIYVHGNSTAVPVMFTSSGPGYHAGDTFGILLLAGHGVSFNSSNSTDVIQFQQAMQQMPEEPVAPQYANWAPGLFVPFQFTSIVVSNTFMVLNGYTPSSNGFLLVQSSTSLLNSNWNTFGTAPIGSNGAFSAFVPKPNGGTMFYRMLDNSR